MIHKRHCDQSLLGLLYGADPLCETLKVLSSFLFIYLGLVMVLLTGQLERDDMRWDGGDDMQQRAAGGTRTLSCCSEDTVSVHGSHAPPNELQVLLFTVNNRYSLY